ncbi:hypothetical protein J437_LFUL011047 [Ladona fulva]|uniref:Anaphase-promoting complex subunit 4-like WD40 domain-containing protein n=1 Tax=Ladona fulva TaxID=123851 RepID=A0A8K0P4Y7_LADFU|nr:hypothetical protein J437_LFUL011047 [Ladona fulva]
MDDNLIITYGKGHLAFWTRRKDGFFERTDIVKPVSPTIICNNNFFMSFHDQASSRTHVTCLQFEADGDVVAGDGDGFITIYSVDADGSYFVRLEFEVKNLEFIGRLFSWKYLNCIGDAVAIGSQNGSVYLFRVSRDGFSYKKLNKMRGSQPLTQVDWSTDGNFLQTATADYDLSFCGVRTIYPQRPGRNDGNIYVGTTKNNIYEGSLQRRFNQVVFGHSKLLWGLAVHPDDEVFATAGHDKYVALWRKHKLVWNTQVQYELVSIAFHPFGMALAAGSSEGHLIILNAETGSHMATVRVCGSPLTCLSFNPGERCKGVSENLHKLVGCQSFVTREECFSNEGCEVVHPNLCRRILSGWYPCISPRAEYNEEKALSSHVASARFMFHDRSVVSVGGTDAAAMLWEVVDD